MKACYKGYFDVAKVLIELGCDVNIQDNYGNTALYFACDKGFKDITELLLRNKALRLKNKLGDRPAVPKTFRGLTNDKDADDYVPTTPGRRRKSSGRRKSRAVAFDKDSLIKKKSDKPKV